MPLDLADLAPGLECRTDGIWFAPQLAPVSYPAHGNAACLQIEDRSFWFRHRNRCITSLVRRFAPGAIFLDIGGGNGYVAHGLIRAGVACALAEPSIEGALAARARGIDPVICARLEDIGMVPGSIEAAGMFDVLEHIEDEAGALRRVHALLGPGGLLFLTVPAYAFLHSADDIEAGHFRRYTLATLTEALRQARFTLAYATYMFAPLLPLVFLLRTVPSKLGLRHGSDGQRLAAEHAPEGPAARLLERLLELEAQRVEAGRSMSFGSSCLAVAVKD